MLMAWGKKNDDKDAIKYAQKKKELQRRQKVADDKAKAEAVSMRKAQERKDRHADNAHRRDLKQEKENRELLRKRMLGRGR
jgi:hypothetical protein